MTAQTTTLSQQPCQNGITYTVTHSWGDRASLTFEVNGTYHPRYMEGEFLLLEIPNLNTGRTHEFYDAEILSELGSIVVRRGNGEKVPFARLLTASAQEMDEMFREEFRLKKCLMPHLFC
jgi:hypothetical protein